MILIKEIEVLLVLVVVEKESWHNFLDFYIDCEGLKKLYIQLFRVKIVNRSHLRYCTPLLWLFRVEK